MKTDIPISDVMKHGVITVDIGKTAVDVAQSLKKNNIGCVIVTQKGKARGIVTERDIVQKVIALGKDAKKAKVQDFMSTPLRVIKDKDSIQDAAEAMKVYNVKRLPVINAKGQLIGIVTESDMVRVLPGLVEVLLEKKQYDEFRPNEELTGLCSICGLHSDSLVREDNGKLVCEECAEEEEV
ncbi:Inosine-5'-monophosphate dehydrogenase [Candidatus Gugararchaeum adminiculabundum]|nr:Inosine-5'-monophosphate dehydrogenase [Candidatus Gugararchaeum adminiculabundum]